MSAVEIICQNCGADTLLRREAVYEGFTKTGELLSCLSCDFQYASEDAVPFKIQQAQPNIFSEADRPAKVEVFDDGENQRLCRYCAHYIINPFTQFCSICKKEVQATDSCGQFEQADETDEMGLPF